MLVTLKNGKTLCRIYKNRLGYVLAKVDGGVILCNERKNSEWNYEGCEYNVEGKPLFTP
jgi:hypothetical protein